MSTPAGWFPDPENPGQQRYFDGTQWTEHRSPSAVMPQSPATAVPAPAAMTVEQRHAILERSIQASVLTGWRPVNVSDTSATMVRGTPVNHVLHLILTLVTCGLWAIVWIIMAAAGGEKRMSMTVDDYGRVLGGR